MIVFSNFRSTTLWKAFVLNAMVASLTIYIALASKKYLDNIQDIDETNPDQLNPDQLNTNWFSATLTIIVTFCTSIISYTIMFILFGFGGSMLSNT